MLTAVHAHCPLCFTWTNWSSKLFLGCRSQSLILICQRTYRRLHGHCVFGDTVWLFFLTSSGIPRPQPWGSSPRFWSVSMVSDLLDASPRRNVRADSFCWRTSVSSVIPLALSATGMSCLNALPVELVRKISYPYFLAQHQIGLFFFKGKRRIIYVSNLSLLLSHCDSVDV